MSALRVFLGGLTPEMVLEIMPEGNTSPEAVAMRIFAYAEQYLPLTPQTMVAFIKAVRSDPDWAPRIGHRRIALMPMLAIVVHAARATDARDISKGMAKMIDEVDAFAADRLSAILEHVVNPDRTGQIDWRKDGGSQRIQCPKILSQNAELVEWCKSPWPPMRSN
jgi:hypothetical protein